MSQRLINWFKFASPASFYPLAGRLWPWFAALAAAFCAAGLWIGFFVAPTDFQQGEGYRIIFIHVPASWMSMFIYCVMAFWAAIGITFNTRLSGMMSAALAPTGALFAFLSLWTGALWGKPMWGAWWVWDARLTSMFVLFLLYIGYMAIWQAIDEPHRAAMVARIVALVGFINIPIVKFSVNWWNSLHQPASVFRVGGPTIAWPMLWPLLVMGLAYTFLFLALHLTAIRGEIAARKVRAIRIAEIGDR